MTPEFFLQPKGCSVFNFGAYLGPSFDEESKRIQNVQALVFMRRFNLIPCREDIRACECGYPLQVMEDIHSNKLGFRYKCNNSSCEFATVSPLKGTILQDCNIKPGSFLKLLVSFFFKRNVTEVVDEAEVSNKSAVAWFQTFREIMRIVEGHDYSKIGGCEDIVEVDETKMFKRKSNTGRITNMERKQLWLFGGVSRLTKSCFIVPVQDRTRDTLCEELADSVEDGTYLISDGWSSYMHIAGRLNYKGQSFVNHSYNFVHPTPVEVDGLHNSLYGLLPPAWRFSFDTPEDATSFAKSNNLITVHSQEIESLWKDLKSHLRKIRDSEPAGNLADYIGEFVYRRDLSSIEGKGQQFHKFLTDIVRVYPGFGQQPIQDKKQLRRQRSDFIIKNEWEAATQMGICDCSSCFTQTPKPPDTIATKLLKYINDKSHRADTALTDFGWDLDSTVNNNRNDNSRCDSRQGSSSQPCQSVTSVSRRKQMFTNGKMYEKRE